MDTVLSACLGVALAASCGFRVFVPLLVVSITAKVGWLSLADSFAWIGTTPAMIVFAAATAVEVGAYYVPWLDNTLDAAAGPIATVAGIVVAAAVMTDMDPLLKWTLAIVAGGGAAGATQVLTTALRGASSVTTLGLANPVVATAELGGSLALSLISIALPYLAAAAVIVMLSYLVFRFLRRPARA